MKWDAASVIASFVAYGAFSAVALVLATSEGFGPVALALAGSAVLFVFGTVTREADIVYLAWLDQGSNLLLVEVQSSAATVVTVSATVVAVLLLADLAHLGQLFARRDVVGGIRGMAKQFWRLAAIGVASGFLAVVGVTLSPVFVLTSDRVVVVAILAVLTLAATAAIIPRRR